MKVIRKDEKNYVKFSELKPGDTFIDPEVRDSDPEMKIEYGDVYSEFSVTEEPREDGFASVSLTTGNVFFYDNDDFYVIPIKLNAVEE